jgi:hypothetical protein
MMRTRVAPFAAAICFAMLADAGVGRAQFGGADYVPTQVLARDVVFQGSRTVSRNTIVIVAAKIAQDLSGENAKKPGAVTAINLYHSAALNTGSGVQASFGPDVAHEPEIRALHVSVRIADDGTPMPAEEMTAIWEKARSALEDGLRKLQATTRENQLREREREIRSAHEALASSRQDYEAAVSRLSALARDLGDGSQAEIQQQLSATLAELRQLKLKMIGLHARRDAIERRIDDLRKVAEEASIDDPVIAELQSAVSAREKVLEHRKRLEKLGVPGGEATFIAEAEANLTDARLQLLRARREAVGGSEGDVLQQLNNELSMLIIQAAEIEATLHATAEMAEELKAKSSAERWSEMDLLRGRLDLAKNRLQAAELTVFDRENRPLPPQEEISIRPLDEVLAPEAESVAP